MISRILANLPELVLAALALYMLSHVPPQPTTEQLRESPASPTEQVCWYEPDVHEHLCGELNQMPANGILE